MAWIAVAQTKSEKRLFAHNWTRRQAERRKAFIESFTGELGKVRFHIERIGVFDWRVLPEVWEEEDVHWGRLSSPADDDRPGSSRHGL
jgi:hypothetical protein